MAGLRLRQNGLKQNVWLSDSKRWVLTLLLLPVVAIASCREARSPSLSNPQVSANPVNAAPRTRPLKVVATFLPMYLFTKAVAGNTAEVSILVKPGTEVHEYQSTPGDVIAIAQADVLVENGLGLESFLDETIKNAQHSQLAVINASKDIQPIGATSQVLNPGESPRAQGANSNASEATKAQAVHSANPHVWLDPTLAKKQVETIRDGLIAVDPGHQATYQTNAAAYIQKLDALDRQFDQSLKGYRDRTFITFHDAFPYLARRYRLNQVAVVTIPEDQLSPNDLQQTIKTVKQFQVKALFSEPGVDNKLLKSLSTDLNLTLHPLDSLESGQLDPDYYFTAMNANLQTLQTAFQ